MAIEAGEIAQNISLAAVEIGLATCELGGMVDDAISEELELDQCLTFLAILIGKESKIKRESIWLTTDELEKKLIYDDGSVAEVWLIDNTFANNYDKSYFQFLARSKDGQITSGISTNWADAKLKAIAEAHERQCSANVRWDKVAKASELDLCWLDPRTIAPLSDEQYSNLSYLQKFHENLEIEWVKGVSLNGQPVFAPIDLIFYPIENVGRKLVVDTCSSGFAAYTNYQEAVYRGLLEIVERDSLMRNWFEKSNPNIISTEMLPTHLRNRTEYWNKKGRDVFFSILVKEA